MGKYMSITKISAEHIFGLFAVLFICLFIKRFCLFLYLFERGREMGRERESLRQTAC